LVFLPLGKCFQTLNKVETEPNGLLTFHALEFSLSGNLHSESNISEVPETELIEEEAFALSESENSKRLYDLLDDSLVAQGRFAVPTAVRSDFGEVLVIPGL